MREPQTNYYQPKQSPKSKFWAIATIVVLAGVALLILWTFLNRNNQVQDNSSLTANTLTTSSVDENFDPEADPDSDGLSNSQEEQYGTNPNDPDTDKDGFQDGEEVNNGYNPNGPGRLDIDSSEPANTDSNQQTLGSEAEFTGVPLSEVFSDNGQTYECSITGGTTEVNTVKLLVKGNNIRQETPVNGVTLIMIVNDQAFYMSGLQDGKFLRLDYDRESGVASGDGVQVKGGIFTNERHLLNTKLIKVDCQSTAIADSEFSVAPELIYNP